MTAGTVFSAARRAEFGGGSYVEMELDPPDKTPADTDRARVLAAEEALGNQNASLALDLLQEVSWTPGSYARALAVRAMRETQRWDALVAAIAEPTSLDELVELVDAEMRLGRLDRAKG